MTWRTRTRCLANRFWLNPVFTQIFDWFSPPGNLGQKGERIAERLLLKKGMYVVDRGYTEKFGEIDLIAIDARTVVFVEVKTRTSDVAGTPIEAVDAVKQEKISLVASSYLKRHGLSDCRSRFDVVAIELDDSSKVHSHPCIKHFEHAFESTV